MELIEYDAMTEKQKEAFKKYIIPGAKLRIESYYDEIDDEWESDEYKELYNECLKLIKLEKYEDLYYFIIDHRLYK